MQGGQTRQNVNCLDSMVWDECDIEKKEFKKEKRILPQWILESKKDNEKIEKK